VIIPSPPVFAVHDTLRHMMNRVREAIEVLRSLPDDRAEAVASAIINYGSDSEDVQQDNEVAERAVRHRS